MQQAMLKRMLAHGLRNLRDRYQHEERIEERRPK